LTDLNVRPADHGVRAGRINAPEGLSGIHTAEPTMRDFA
jgi:hypothetical protein